MDCCGIYKFTDKDNNKVYIGQSKSIWQRYALHYSHAFSLTYEKLSTIDQQLFDRPDRFDFEIIEICPEEELTVRETYWIDYYDSLQSGYNTVKPRLIYQFTREGELVGQYCGYAEAARATGHPNGSGNILRCCQGELNTAYGFHWSLSPDLNKCEVEISKRPTHSTKKRAVQQLDLEGNIIQEFSSCTAAAKAVGATPGAICHVCNGRAKSCKGYKWMYVEQE